jgi:hypothetical protein
MNGEDNQQERIGIIQNVAPGALWTPVVGPETLDLRDQMAREVSDESAERACQEAVAILSRCAPTTGEPDRTTGLVVGYIQSGKTMSFTTVTTLARDNGYAMVIVITGTSVPLFNQSYERLTRDLRLASRQDRKWRRFPNPTTQQTATIRDTLADWRDPEVPRDQRQTVLIIAMKQHSHLANLGNLLRSLNLDGLSVLVIDDEADQAGLNTLVRQGRESTTYQRLLALRQLLPRHSFLQYTATPQAPLLINLIDVLSPEFGEVIQPGDQYVGGRDFFVQNPQLIETIPPDDIGTRDEPLVAPPESLLNAMRLFFLGVAAGNLVDQERDNRSMLVHPSQQTLPHTVYAQWVRTIKQSWENILAAEAEDLDRQQLVEDFRAAYVNLQQTVNDLPTFENLMAIMRRAIRRTAVAEINAVRGRTPSVDWNSVYAHILVGGQALDRGVTVQGLTVTYMPRGIGGGNADSVQQRARFLGYKRRYLGYCRIFLEAQTRECYTQYVSHEEDIRGQLIEYRGRPLAEWKRAFFLSRALQPTRINVLGLDYMQGTFSNEWFKQSAAYESEEPIRWNDQIARRFLAELTLQPNEGHPDRTEIQRHQVAFNVPLQRAYEQLLVQMRITDARESEKYIGLRLQVLDFLERNPDATCTIYRMSPSRNRVRDIDGFQLFQGEAPVSPRERRGEVYPGDTNIKADTGLTIQIHYLELRREGQTVFNDVPTIAVWVPREMERDWVVQPQGGDA